MEDESNSPDDFKWFGEGFEGFPKRLPEDCVEYALYVVNSETQTNAEIRTRLKQVQHAAADLVKRLLLEYIWQRNAFALELTSEDGVPVLRGRTNFGDSVADEWLIVYLLRELSRQFSDLWLRVHDTDGEFLLIEAANVLPRWLNPEVAENRVWINSGSLRVIPRTQPTSATTLTKPITHALPLEEALAFVRATPMSLIHSPIMESEAFFRLRNYPAEISSSLHTALITIPRALASILRQSPAYISPAVEAFYLRDPISLRPLRAKSATNLVFPPSDLVNMAVRFTKVGYAQIKSQEFAPPSFWAPLLASSGAGGEKSRERMETGMKVTCGFEMLLGDPHNQDKRTVREIRLLLDDIQEDSGLLPTDEEIAKWAPNDDDESWLNINFEDFERELSGQMSGNAGATKAGNTSRYSSAPHGASGFGDKAAAENLKKMVERFESFIDDENAGEAGAEDVDEMDVDDDSTNNQEAEEDAESSEGEEKDLSFDKVEFARMMHEMMSMPSSGPSKPILAHHGAAAARTKKAEIDDSGGPRASESQEDGSTDGSEVDEDESESIRTLMQRMEAELREAGALDLEPKSRENYEIGRVTTTAENEPGGKDGTKEGLAGDDEDESVHINLAKHLLNSFKAQGGTAGPASSIMDILGVKFPRDEGEDVSGEKSSKQR